MEALKFLQEAHRMCGMRDCDNCPVEDIYCGVTKEKYDLAKYVEIVEKWSREHPAKTRQSEFLKLYPNAHRLDTIQICPATVDNALFESGAYNCRSAKFDHSEVCHKCMRDYWLTEVE